MEDEVVICDMDYQSFFITVALSITALVFIMKCVKKVGQVAPCLMTNPDQKPVILNLHKEVEELRNNARKINTDWEEMVNLVKSLKEQQFIFMDHFKSEVRQTNETLHRTILESSKEFCMNGQKVEEIVHSFFLQLDFLKEIARNQAEAMQRGLEKQHLSANNLANVWTQTEREIVVKRRLCDIALENENPKSATSGIKRILIEFQKEARKNSIKEREAVMSHIEAILSQMSEDQVVIKNSIQQAFEASNYQSQKTFEELGSVGQKAIQYIAEKNEKSNVLMKDKFQEFDKKLNVIFDSMHTSSFEVSAIKSTLDGIDSQLDEIFQKMELGCQQNVEHCEEVLEGLKNATNTWRDSTNRLTDMSRLLTVIINGVEQLMTNLNEKTDDSKQLMTALSSIPKDKAIVPLTTKKDSKDFEANLQPFVHLQNLIQGCNTKVSSLNDRLENGMGEIKLTIENLLRQIRFMCDLVDSLSERFNFLEIKSVRVKSFEDKKNLDTPGDTRRNFKTEPNKSNINIILNEIPTDYRSFPDPKLPKPKRTATKTKSTASPVKKGKSVYSSISSFNVYAKTPERNQGPTRK